MVFLGFRHTNNRSSTREDAYDLENGESDSRQQRSSGSDERVKSSPRFVSLIGSQLCFPEMPPIVT